MTTVLTDHSKVASVFQDQHSPSKELTICYITPPLVPAGETGQYANEGTKHWTAAGTHIRLIIDKEKQPWCVFVVDISVYTGLDRNT